MIIFQEQFGDTSNKSTNNISVIPSIYRVYENYKPIKTGYFDTNNTATILVSRAKTKTGLPLLLKNI